MRRTSNHWPGDRVTDLEPTPIARASSVADRKRSGFGRSCAFLAGDRCPAESESQRQAGAWFSSFDGNCEQIKQDLSANGGADWAPCRISARKPRSG
jgi:hypothetical protein